MKKAKYTSIYSLYVKATHGGITFVMERCLSLALSGCLSLQEGGQMFVSQNKGMAYRQRGRTIFKADQARKCILLYVQRTHFLVVSGL